MALPLEQPLPCAEFAALEAADRPRFQIDDLCVYLESYLSAEQIREVYRAYQFGAEAHAGQTRTYAKSKTGLQRTLDIFWIVHNFIRKHFTTQNVPAVALGILEQGLSWEQALTIQKSPGTRILVLINKMAYNQAEPVPASLSPAKRPRQPGTQPLPFEDRQVARAEIYEMKSSRL